MALIRHGKLADDIWRVTDDFADPQALASMGPIIVDLDTWRRHRLEILEFDGPIGLRLQPGQTPDLVASDLHNFDLIALEFAKFTDGRAYSQARLLRERHGFKGELRAVGDVLRDQLTFMLRCGFDSFQVATDARAAAILAAVDEFAHWYQPALDRATTIPTLRRAGETSPETGVAATWAY